MSMTCHYIALQKTFTFLYFLVAFIFLNEIFVYNTSRHYNVYLTCWPNALNSVLYIIIILSTILFVYRLLCGLFFSLFIDI